jgi:hypothetical protein
MIYASYKNEWGFKRFEVSRINRKTYTLTSSELKAKGIRQVTVPKDECELSFERFKGSFSEAVSALENMPLHIRLEAAPYYLNEEDLLEFLRQQAEDLTRQFNFETLMIEAAAELALDNTSDETKEVTGYYTVEDIVCSIEC